MFIFCKRDAEYERNQQVEEDLRRDALKRAKEIKLLLLGIIVCVF